MAAAVRALDRVGLREAAQRLAVESLLHRTLTR
jgi:hypothetical protein